VDKKIVYPHTRLQHPHPENLSVNRSALLSQLHPLMQIHGIDLAPPFVVDKMIPDLSLTPSDDDRCLLQAKAKSYRRE
jgi:hypothetical protein